MRADRNASSTAVGREFEAEANRAAEDGVALAVAPPAPPWYGFSSKDMEPQLESSACVDDRERERRERKTGGGGGCGGGVGWGGE